MHVFTIGAPSLQYYDIVTTVDVTGPEWQCAGIAFCLFLVCKGLAVGRNFPFESFFFN